jgi:hypothetical protein
MSIAFPSHRGLPGIVHNDEFRQGSRCFARRCRRLTRRWTDPPWACKRPELASLGGARGGLVLSEAASSHGDD